jgi:hypothetical protein
MDEVDLQSELSIVREQMRGMAHVRAQKEIEIEYLSDSLRFYEQENHEMSVRLREDKFKQIQEEIDKEIAKIGAHQPGEREEAE